MTLTKVLILLQSAVAYSLLWKLLLFAESRSWKPVPKHWLYPTNSFSTIYSALIQYLRTYVIFSFWGKKLLPSLSSVLLDNSAALRSSLKLGGGCSKLHSFSSQTYCAEEHWKIPIFSSVLQRKKKEGTHPLTLLKSLSISLSHLL